MNSLLESGLDDPVGQDLVGLSQSPGHAQAGTLNHLFVRKEYQFLSYENDVTSRSGCQREDVCHGHPLSLEQVIGAEIAPESFVSYAIVARAQLTLLAFSCQ